MPDIPLPIHDDPNARKAFGQHSRHWLANRYVYPVVSRRSKGISIGVNLNPDKACNFDCIYCCVDRKVPGGERDVELPVLRTELAAMLAVCRSGEIYRHEPFDKIPAALRRVNDIAFSGDGEPTTCPMFVEAVALAAELKRAAALSDVKLVLISNATVFERPRVRAGLRLMWASNGEVWGKLDAGTEEYYQIVDRTNVPLKKVMRNLVWAAQQEPLVVQSLFMRVHGQAPPPEEIAAYVARLKEIVAAGGQIKLVQVYTVARGTAEAYATALTREDLAGIAQPVREAGLAVEVYP